MSIRTVSASPTTSNAGLNIRTLDGNYITPPTTTPWVRNPSWVALPTVLSTDQKVVGLYAVFPGDGVGNGGNFFAATCAAAYTIDFGDGTTTNFATGIQANYEYNYNNAALNGTDAPVTFTDTGDLVTRTAHGYTDGMTVEFYNIVTTTGITAAAQYFVISATANTFQISDSLGGSAVALTNDGTGTLLPYKQAIVTITPQAANNLTSVNLFIKHNQTGLNAYSTGWLDLAIAMANGSTLTIGSSATTLRHGLLEQAVIKRFTGTNFQSIFENCTALRSIDVSGISTVNNMTNMFSNCTSLTNVLLTDTDGVTAFTSMFFNCTALRTVPLFNTANASSTASMFSGCSSLTSVPLFNTSAANNTGTMFNGCTSLTSVPLFDFSNSTTVSQMFNLCTGLTTVPLFKIRTTGTVSMTQMFNGCTSLTSVPLFNTVAVTNMGTMFQNCTSLTSVPLFNTAAVTFIGNMFSGCSSLTNVPLFNTVSATSMASMFINCKSLITVPLFNTTSVADFSSMFSGCISLTTVPLFSIKTTGTVNMSSMFLNCTALITVPLFNTVAVNTMAIMFSGCSSLTTVPLFNTAAVTAMNSMFLNCVSLTTVPLFNTAANTFTISMFENCKSLVTIPLFNTAAVTNMQAMFFNCASLNTVPALVTTAVTSSANFSTTFANCNSLTRIQAKNFRFTFAVASLKLSKTALEEIFSNLPSTVVNQILTITSNYGNPTAISLTGTRTAGNAVILMASTANLAVGMLLTGTGINTAVAVTIQGNPTNTVTRVAHGIPDGTRVSFASIVTTTGISTYTPYFVVNATVDTFQLSLTLGGAAITLTNNGSGTLLYGTFITAIVPNVSITVTVPPSASGATALTFRELNASIATLKNWALTF